MNNRNKKRFYFISIFFLQTLIAFTQKSDSTIVLSHFGSAVTVTTNGISTIPNLTLGKPAAIFDLSLGKGKLSFEPQFRFSLEGKPWSFIFWWRYKAIKTDRFQLGIGAHPAFAFKTITAITGDVTHEIISVQRYIASEIVPTYSLSKNISAGIYYLYSYCLEKGGLRNTNYVAGRIIFSNIRLTENTSLSFMPQVYYLRMDKYKGYYLNSFISLSTRNFPVSVTSTINKTIKTDIPVGKDFLWNVSLVYAFNKDYQRR